MPYSPARLLSQRLTRSALRQERLEDPARALFIVRQLDSIAGDMHALMWSIGLAWALRVERVICSMTPQISSLLLFPALYCTTHCLIGRLVWYGMPPSALGLAYDVRGLLRLALCIGVLALVGSVAPGQLRRRLFVTSAFPFLGLTGLFGATWGMDVITAVRLADHYQIVQTLLRGIGFGLAIPALLSIPALLLYREVAAPVGILSLVPAFARSNWTANTRFHGCLSLADFIWLGYPFLCAAIGIVIATSACRRWQQYSIT
jgi:hypothetical protein